MLTKQAAIDLTEYGIKVASISPGWVKTEMGGENAKYEVSESVAKIIKVTDQLNPSQNGRFWERMVLKYHGRIKRKKEETGSSNS